MIIQTDFHSINNMNTMQDSKLSKLGGCILATRGKIDVAKSKNMDPKFQLMFQKKRFCYNLITVRKWLEPRSNINIINNNALETKANIGHCE